ncbi:amidase, partial [Tremellales sp. Uapishka_1]
MHKPLHKLSATEVVALTRSGELKVEDYAKALIARVQERDSVVHAWAYFNPEVILASARALDALPEERRGPLHGVAVGVKDVIHTRDMPTQHFSPIYKDDKPELDAAVVLTLRASGALIFGKTHTTEFATCQRGPPTCNPHDPTRTAGGSSSGSGAAVGDFQVPLALGTQTGGSTIRPASYNGVFALKPTWNAISREGLKMYSITCDTVGLYSRSADDLSLLCDVFRLKDDTPPSPEKLDLKGAKFGFVKTHVWEKAKPSVVAAWEKAKQLLESSGAAVEEVDLPSDFDNMTTWHRNILHMEGQSSFLGDYIKSSELLDPWVTKHVVNDSNTTRREMLDSYDNIARLRPVMDSIASKYTALITPSVTEEAPVMEEPLRFTGDASFNLMWTVLHLPVVNVPGFVGPNGMPIGLSLIAPRYHEEDLVRTVGEVAKVFENGGWALSQK